MMSERKDNFKHCGNVEHVEYTVNVLIQMFGVESHRIILIPN